MSMTDPQRRSIDNVRSMVVDAQHRTRNAEREVRECLPPGAQAVLLADAADNMQLVIEILDAMLNVNGDTS